VLAYAIDAGLLFAVLAPAGLLVNALLGTMPRTGPGIWRTILWNFSLPVWLYFTAGDASARGQTIAKRLLRIQVTRLDGGRLSWARGLGRTAVRLLPWELTHVSAFALSDDLAVLAPWQGAGLVVVNVLLVAYLAVAVVTRGRRSVHDLAAGTAVRALPS
jgi:uncharacterized RDD family membrane protein YckC